MVTSTTKRGRRTRLLFLVAAVAYSLSLATGEVRAHEGDSTPSDAEQVGSIEPPVVPADAIDGGPRVFVRTNLVNTTEYLMFRFKLIESGFADVLEAAPGSFMVAIGDLSLVAAQERLGAFDEVVDVVPAFGFAEEADDSSGLPPWWVFASLAVPAVFVALQVTRRPRVEESDGAPVG